MGTPLRAHTQMFVLALCVVTVIGACADPRPTAGSDSTSTTVPGSGSTTTDSPVATTMGPTTTVVAGTSTSMRGGESTSTPIVPAAGDPPEVELKEPGYYEVLPSEEVGDHFIFGIDVSPSHTTTYISSAPAETGSMTARVDGDLIHYLGTGGLAGEMMERGSEVWVRDDSGEWVIDEEMFELPIFVAFPSPDVAYAVAYGVFETLEFVGWVETNGEDLAVYEGGPDASAKVLEGLGEDPPADHDGSVEVWWSLTATSPRSRWRCRPRPATSR